MTTIVDGIHRMFGENEHFVDAWMRRFREAYQHAASPELEEMLKVRIHQALRGEVGMRSPEQMASLLRLSEDEWQAQV